MRTSNIANISIIESFERIIEAYPQLTKDYYQIKKQKNRALHHQFRHFLLERIRKKRHQISITPTQTRRPHDWKRKGRAYKY